MTCHLSLINLILLFYTWNPYKTRNLEKLVSEKPLAVFAKVAVWLFLDRSLCSFIVTTQNRKQSPFYYLYWLLHYTVVQPHALLIFQIFSVWLINGDIYCYCTYCKEMEKPKDLFQYSKATFLVGIDLYLLLNTFSGASLGKHALHYQQIRVNITLTTLKKASLFRQNIQAAARKKPVLIVLDY